MDRLWRSNSSISSRIGFSPGIVNEEDHNVEKHGASILMCLHDAKSRNFENNIYCMANVSLNDHVYFNHYSETSLLITNLLVKKKIMVNLLTLTFLPLIILIMLSN